MDALYFTMTMVSTVGFGDITATGQLARVLVTLQMAFNLLFIAALVRLFQQTLEGRRSPRHED
ncbi:potassium channel family protein [Janibacter alkaliphilus]|nr:potassium channel family protein [Janibacter alkaliphilus]